MPSSVIGPIEDHLVTKLLNLSRIEIVPEITARGGNCCLVSSSFHPLFDSNRSCIPCLMFKYFALLAMHFENRGLLCGLCAHDPLDDDVYAWIHGLLWPLCGNASHALYDEHGFPWTRSDGSYGRGWTPCADAVIPCAADSDLDDPKPGRWICACSGSVPRRSMHTRSCSILGCIPARR